jgi:hypothetical protein
MTWEIRKVWVARVGMNIAYCGEDAKRAVEVKDAVNGRPTEQTMVAVRFSPAGKVEEVQYLATCARLDYPDPLDGAEIDITRGA